MKQKLIAAAVVGAFAAPAAFAQNSSVQIYGLLNAEYGFSNQIDTAGGQGRSSVDALNSGASRIGFKGEEKLGGGMSAFFQCESDIRFLSGSQTSTSGAWCDRNSALGLKGGFGSFYVGIWDSPLKRVSGITRITNETGWLGSQHMTLGTYISSTGATATFSNRNQQTLNYDTPKFGGFSASFQYTTTNPGLGSNTIPTPKGRIMGASGQYVQGPLAVVLGYEVKDDNRTDAALNGTKDTAWALGGAYTWGNLKVGLTYAVVSQDVTVSTEEERKAWNLAGEYKLGGPGSVRVGYANAGDWKGNGAVGTDTGAKQWQIAYLHALSKRTNAYIGYVRLSNDTNGQYNLQGVSGTRRAGDSSSAFALGLNHTF